MGSHNVHMSNRSWIETSLKIYMFVKKVGYLAKLDEVTQRNFRQNQFIQSRA
jgi:hypothetical protein